MKTIYSKLFTIVFILFSSISFAQSNSINYKAIISEDGNALSSTLVTMQFTILEGATSVYQETHSVTTDENGIVIANIGEGTVISGVYADINWSSDNHFLKTEVDSGSGYKDMGTTEFHAVPYAISGGSVKSLNDLSDAITVQASTYIGYNAGATTNNSGLWNVGIGKEALKSVTNKNFNTAIGGETLANLTGGSENTALGMTALFYNKDGGYNTSLGSRSGYKTKGSNNIFIGYKAGYNELGSNKLYIESSDSNTPLIGGDFSTDEVVINGTLQVTGGTPGVGKVLTSDANGKATWEIAAESGASEINDLSDAVYDGQSLYLGYNSGLLDDNSNYNTSVGRESMKANTSGRQNVSIGSQTLLNNETGSYNVALGEGALYKNIAGEKNISIGEKAGFNSLGSSNMFIGYQAGLNETGDNKLYIENSSSTTPLIGGDFSTDEVVINGTLTVTGGNPADGKVLTSDASGKATWETVSIPVTSNTIAYGPYNIMAATNSVAFERYLGYFIPEAGNNQYYIPINIPIGSKIMSMKVNYYDFSNDADIEVVIYKKNESTASTGNWGGISSSGNDTNLRTATINYGGSSHITQSDELYVIIIRAKDGTWEGTRATSISSIELTYEK